MQQKFDEKCRLSQIQNERFCLRSDLNHSAMVESIRKLGLLQPLTVMAAKGKRYELVSGHRRLAALKQLKKKTVPVFIISESDPISLFLTALVLNHPMTYTDLDRCRIIQMALAVYKMSPNEIQKTVMPLMGLASSPKVFNQYQAIGSLPESVIEMIQKNQLPFVGSQGLAKFQPEDLQFILRRVFIRIRPSASQLAHICEWLFDLIQTQKKSAELILKNNPILKTPPNQDQRALTDVFYQWLRAVRFPELVRKEKAFAQVAKELRGGISGLEIKAPDHFEQEGFYVHAHIQNAKSLVATLRQLQTAQNEASALFDTLL